MASSSSDIMEALMKDPVKRAMVLQLLSQERDGFEAYKKRDQKKHVTPVKKIQKLHCESPTALQRRRALERLNQDSVTSESSSSELSDVTAEIKGPKVPFDKLLKGVKAYVEVRRNNVDRSEGIKTVMKLMGATIKDDFTNDVTHVVFKDGSFKTYQKAKLLKIHLVSVLWLDAVRRNQVRVPEKNYPAFGSRVPEEEVSILCSQLQKEYEDVVKDEKRRSMSGLSQFSNKIAEKNRRKTMMTPQASRSSYLTAVNASQSLFSDDDSKRKSDSPDLTSDDSDCGMIDGQINKRPKDQTDVLKGTPDFTDDSGKSGSGNSNSAGSESLINRVFTRNKRPTINITSNMVITPCVGSQSILQRCSEIGDSNKILQSSIQSSAISSLRVSSCSSDRTKSGLDLPGNSNKNSDSRHTVSVNSVTTVGTTMSSLRLSDSCEKNSDRKTASESREIQRNHSPRESSSKENSPEIKKNVNSRRSRSVCVLKSSDKIDEKKSKPVKRITNAPRRSRSLLGSESEDEAVGTKNCEHLADVSNSNKQQRKTPYVLLSKPDIANGGEILKPGNNSSHNDDQIIPSSRSKSETKRQTVKLNVVTDLINQNRTSVATNLFKKSRASSVASSKSESGVDVDSNEKSTTKHNTKLLSSTSSEVELERINQFVTTRKPRRSKSTDLVKENNEGSSCSSRSASTVRRSNSRKSVTPQRTTSPQTNPVQNTSIKTVEESRRSRPKNRNTENNESGSSRSESAVGRPNSRKSVTPQRSTSPQTHSGPSTSSSKTESTLRRRNNAKSPSPQTTPSPAKRSRIQGSATKKVRALFNPSEITALSPSEDDKEREEHFKQKSKKSPKDLFVNPNNVKITPLPSKSKTTNLDVSMEPIDWSSSDDGKKTEKTQERKKKNRKNKTPPPRDSGADEQRELLELLTKKTSEDIDRRRSERQAVSKTNPKYTFSSDSQSTSSLPITPIKRRSTLDFQTISQTQEKRKLKLDRKPQTSIVCTKFHRGEVFNFEMIVKDLGRFFVEYKVTDRTTHLVAGESKRTINMLRAIARGCWILKPEWLLGSKRAGRWLSEEDYEDTDFSPAVQKSRLQRQAFGPKYSVDIFKDCGWIFVGKSATPKSEDLKELITICQGKVTTIYRNADIVVGELIQGKSVTCVTEMWVLDSITCNKLKPLNKYLIKSAGAGSPQY